MLRIAPHSGEFRLLVKPTGEVVAPDLAAPLLPILQAVADRDELPSMERIACPVETPKLTLAKLPAIDLSASNLPSLSTAELWRIHTAALQNPLRQGICRGASLLDVKAELGRRMLQRCAFCGHCCYVDRTEGQTGFCELGPGLCISGYSMLYNEGPFVGQPTFGMFLKGCSLRCCFCYRSQDLHASNQVQSPPECVASILDHAAEAGAESWHFLGGNPDQSVVAVLEALRHVRYSLPVVWNSALYVSREGLELLRGVVDVWVPDFKFGSDRCGQIMADVPDYSAIVRANLLALRNETHVVVRHMRYPGHERCCQAVVEGWVRDNMSGAQLHLLNHIPITPRATA